MEPFSSSLSHIFSVSQLNGQIRELLETALPFVKVRGEIYDLKTPPSGHVYFTLGDGESQIRAVIWRTSRLRLAHAPRSGDAVLVTGRVAVYTPRGEYQLVVEGLTPAGAGLEREMLLRLHGKLAAEGLFNPERKRPLPLLPSVIGVVTSRSGAVLQDILRILDQRLAAYHVLLAHARVQGEGAAEEIARALDRLNQDGRCQVILCGRGGGAAEDLSAFNSEIVVRAIARSRIPVISAVGHEVDTTLADLVADVRAPTPTAAAQLASADHHTLQQRLHALQQRLQQTLRHQLALKQAQLHHTRQQLRHPRQRLDALRRLCDELPDRMTLAMARGLEKRQSRLRLLQQQLTHWAYSRQWSQRANLLEKLTLRLTVAATAPMANQRQKVASLAATLASLSPLGVLQRGYALVRTAEGTIVRQATSLQPGQEIRLTLAQGEVEATVQRHIVQEIYPISGKAH